VYIDLNHLELCLPEVRSAYDYVAAWHAMLATTRQALEKANAHLPSGQTIHVLVNNSDGLGHSYGSHLNILLTRQAWDTMFHRKLHHLMFLAAFQASSIVLTGQGKVGSENGAPPVDFQLSQRADFFETLVGPQTTFQRPLVNSRDEALCGQAYGQPHTDKPVKEFARLHCIFFDSTLCQVATLLKVGLMQMVCAMLEAGYLNTDLVLEDPVEAVKLWSHDPSLQTRARTVSGKTFTAVELQWLFIKEVQTFAQNGGLEGIVPQFADLLKLWEDTLAKLEARDFFALIPRLDWVLKRSLLQRAISHSPELTWTSPEIKHLDHLYSSLNPSDGLWCGIEKSGALEQPIAQTQIDRFETNPPTDTRAWTRAMALRWMEQSASELTYMNWDCLRFRQKGKAWWGISHTLTLNNPLSHTKAEAGEKFGKANTREEKLEALGAELAPTNAALPVKDTSARWEDSHQSRFPAPRTNQIWNGSTISSGSAHYSGEIPSKGFTSLSTRGGNTPHPNEGEDHDPT
jgi:proteasome accessory factor A